MALIELFKARFKVQEYVQGRFAYPDLKDDPLGTE